MTRGEVRPLSFSCANWSKNPISRTVAGAAAVRNRNLGAELRLDLLGTPEHHVSEVEHRHQHYGQHVPHGHVTCFWSQLHQRDSRGDHTEGAEGLPQQVCDDLRQPRRLVARQVLFWYVEFGLVEVVLEQLEVLGSRIH